MSFVHQCEMLFSGQFVRRALGTASRGPKLRDISGNFQQAIAFFNKPALSYSTFHQRCTSLRLFVFWGVIGALSFDLITSPPKSAYWLEWNIWRWPVNIWAAFTTPSGSLFQDPIKERSVDVPAAYAFLVANRRMPEESALAVHQEIQGVTHH